MVDITFHRDDVSVRRDEVSRRPQPVVGATETRLPGGGDDLHPRRDRSHRKLPIRPDYVGKNLPTAHGERIHVREGESLKNTALTLDAYDPT